MTVDAIEAAIAKGRGKAASVLGRTFSLYRPADPLAPMATVNTMLPCLFTPQPDAYRAPNLPAKPWWYGEFDTRITRPGDILVGAAGTWFIFDQQQYTAPICVGANHKLRFLRPTSAEPGADFYGGDIAASETPLMTGWPASVLQGTKGEAGDTKLPGDPRTPWVAIIVPSFQGVQLMLGDIAYDDAPAPRRYVLSSVEQSAFGYRITAAYART